MMHHDSTRDGPADRDEPRRDIRLAGLLREVVGDPPATVDWAALGSRIGAAVRTAHPSPWWSYAERWQRRAIPIALAAGLLGTATLWATRSTATIEVASGAISVDAVATLVAGGSSDEAASTFAGTIANTTELTGGVSQ